MDKNNSRKTAASTPRGITVRKRSPRSASSVSEMSTTPGRRKGKSPKTNGSTPSTLSSSAGPQYNDDEAEEKADRAFAANHPHDYDSEFEDVDDDYEDELREEYQKQLLDADVETSAADMSFIASDPTSTAVDIYGAPPGWKPPGPPDDWKEKERKPNQPLFKDLDNPGKWSPCHYQPKCDERGHGKYKGHFLPTGAVPCPKNSQGNRVSNGWEFNYDGTWTAPEGSNYRHGATRDNMFPPERQGSLDADKLRKLGMSANRIKDENDNGKVDALFFFQTIRPICDTRRSGITGDDRDGYYFPVANWTNSYASQKGIGCGHGHKFDQVHPWDIVKWEGALVMDGVLGGSDGALYRRWDAESKQYDEDIASNITHTRFNEIKRAIKLCNNNDHPKKGCPKYNPAYKYDYAFSHLVSNVNCISDVAQLDLCADETTFPYNGYGEAGTGVISRVKKKPGVTKGGQLVLVSDVHRIRPRAYVHRHKCHKSRGVKGGNGANEVVMILDQLDELIIDATAESTNEKRGIFKSKPHIAWDNYFSGNGVMEYVATNGCGMTCTVGRGKLPTGVPDKYWHKEQTSTDRRTKACRFLQPIVVHKQIVDSTVTITSFQSTSSCNICSINAFGSCSLYAETRQRGRGQYKREWGIEMNEARSLYLKTYGAIDRIDHLLRNCRLALRSLKYWHAGMIHALGMTIVVAYDIYKECCEGFLNPEWVNPDPVSFYVFREQLAKQMLGYDPSNMKYPGDQFMRPTTQKRKRDRSANAGALVNSPVARFNITGNQQTTTPARKKARGNNSASSSSLSVEKIMEAAPRLCGDMSCFVKHQKSVTKLRGTSKRTCGVCGGKTQCVCGVCDTALHPDKLAGDGVNCFTAWHDSNFYGLARNDYELKGILQRDFHLPDSPEQRDHAAKLKAMMSDESTSNNSKESNTSSSTSRGTATINRSAPTNQSNSRTRSTNRVSATTTTTTTTHHDSDDSDDLYGGTTTTTATPVDRDSAPDDVANNPNAF